MIIALSIVCAALLSGLVAALVLLQRRAAAPVQDAALPLIQQQVESLRAQLSDALSHQTQAMNQQIGQLTGQVNARLEAVNQQMMLSQKTVGERLDNAARVVGDVQKSLGQLGQASERIFEVGKDIAGLQEILRAPKIRGGLGEFFLEDLLKQILPAKHFTMQHGFKAGEKVDAVIRLGEKLVPVDSKFPLENFRRVLAVASEEERRTMRKKFLSDVKKHVDAIADKYICPDEGTYDFALMYIPAENVYYEMILKEDADGAGALSEYALSRRVIPVSPNSFYVYLQSILLGLRGFQIEENARALMENLSRLQGDLRKFVDEFEILGRHISNTKTKYDDAEKRLSRLHDRLLSAHAGSVDGPSPSAAPLPPPIPSVLPGLQD